MANSESIKRYLIEDEKSYLENDANNGTILMLSGVWGSGKTHFWKNIIETDLEFVNSTVYIGYAHGDIFLDQLKLAAHNKVPIKNCFLCRYSGNNWDYANNQPIFCKAKKFK